MWSTTLQFLALEYVHSVQRHIVPILASLELINATKSTSLDMNIAKSKIKLCQKNLRKFIYRRKKKPGPKNISKVKKSVYFSELNKS